jgi:hypothetical protein
MCFDCEVARWVMPRFLEAVRSSMINRRMTNGRYAKIDFWAVRLLLGG